MTTAKQIDVTAIEAEYASALAEYEQAASVAVVVDDALIECAQKLADLAARHVGVTDAKRRAFVAALTLSRRLARAGQPVEPPRYARFRGATITTSRQSAVELHILDETYGGAQPLGDELLHPLLELGEALTVRATAQRLAGSDGGLGGVLSNVIEAASRKTVPLNEE